MTVEQEAMLLRIGAEELKAFDEIDEKFENYYDAMLTDTIFEATQFPHCVWQNLMILMRSMRINKDGAAHGAVASVQT